MTITVSNPVRFAASASATPTFEQPYTLPAGSNKLLVVVAFTVKVGASTTAAATTPTFGGVPMTAAGTLFNGVGATNATSFGVYYLPVGSATTTANIAFGSNSARMGAYALTLLDAHQSTAPAVAQSTTLGPDAPSSPASGALAIAAAINGGPATANRGLTAAAGQSAISGLNNRELSAAAAEFAVAVTSKAESGGAVSCGYTAGAAGNRQANIVAAFAPAASTSPTITLNEVAAGSNIILQRGKGSTSRAVAISGSYAHGTPTGIAFRLKAHGTATVVQDWTAATGFSATGGSWIATASIPQGGKYSLEVRDSGNISTMSGGTANSFSVGAIAICTGQSLMQGLFTTSGSIAYAGANAYYDYATNAWSQPSNQAAAGELANRLSTKLGGIPVGLVNTSTSAQAIRYHAPAHSSTDGAVAAGAGWASKTAVALAALGDVELVLLDVGQTPIDSFTPQRHTDAQNAIYAGVQAATGRSGGGELTMLVALVGSSADLTTAQVINTNLAIRAGGQTVAVETFDLPRADSVHLDAAGKLEQARRFAEMGDAIGPAVTTATRIGTAVTVSFNAALSGPTNGITGWEYLVDGTPVAISGVTRSGNQVFIELAWAPSSGIEALRHAYSNEPTITTLARGMTPAGSALAVPVQRTLVAIAVMTVTLVSAVSAAPLAQSIDVIDGVPRPTGLYVLEQYSADHDPANPFHAYWTDNSTSASSFELGVYTIRPPGDEPTGPFLFRPSSPSVLFLPGAQLFQTLYWFVRAVGAGDVRSVWSDLYIQHRVSFVRRPIAPMAGRNVLVPEIAAVGQAGGGAATALEISEAVLLPIDGASAAPVAPPVEVKAFTQVLVTVAATHTMPQPVLLPYSLPVASSDSAPAAPPIIIFAAVYLGIGPATADMSAGLVTPSEPTHFSLSLSGPIASTRVVGLIYTPIIIVPVATPSARRATFSQESRRAFAH